MIVLLAATSVELFWRAHGFRPQPEDNEYLWSLRRAEADAGSRVLVLAGSSRFQLGLRVGTLRQEFPAWKVVQLSVSGGSPLSVLANLGADPQFRGTVLCEVLPHMTFTGIRPTEVWPGMSTRPFSSESEGWFQAALGRHLVILGSDLKLNRVWTELRTKGRLPDPNLRRVNADRECQVDYSHVDVAAVERQYEHDYASIGQWLTPAALLERIRWMHQQAADLQARGGNVIFFQMIASGRVEAVEKRNYPSETYWNVLRDNVGAPAFRYDEVPGVAALRCAEGAHLDRKDAGAFTLALAHELEVRQLLK